MVLNYKQSLFQIQRRKDKREQGSLELGSLTNDDGWEGRTYSLIQRGLLYHTYQYCESGSALIFGRLDPDPEGAKMKHKYIKKLRFHVGKCRMFSFEGWRLLLSLWRLSWKYRNKKKISTVNFYNFWSSNFGSTRIVTNADPQHSHTCSMSWSHTWADFALLTMHSLRAIRDLLIPNLCRFSPVDNALLESHQGFVDPIPEQI